MMIKKLKHFIFLLLALPCSGQQGLVLKSNVIEHTRDVWGYVDSNGAEYALATISNGVLVLRLSSDGSVVEEVARIEPGYDSNWWDIKTWGQWAYATNESGGGLLIIDLRFVGDNIVEWRMDDEHFESAHNIFIDERGIAFIAGPNPEIFDPNDTSPGVLLLQLGENGEDITYLGGYDQYAHDIYVRDGLLFTAEIYNGTFAILDVSNPQNIEVIARHFSPLRTTHSVWPSNDGSTLYIADEVFGGFFAAYDISDFSEIKELDRIKSFIEPGAIPHNMQITQENFLVSSYSSEGVVIYDTTYPSNLIKVTQYDTFEDGQGQGCWGVFTGLPSGLILVTDTDYGLFVFEANLEQASYIVGSVNDEEGRPLSQANIEIEGFSQSITTSNLLGEFKTGAPTQGEFNIIIDKPGFKTLVVENIVLNSGETTNITAQLEKEGDLNLSFQLINNLGEPIGDAALSFAGDEGSFDTVSNEMGWVELSNVKMGTYDLILSKWGFKSKLIESIDLSGNFDAQNVDFTMSLGYYDDFSTDLGWLSSADEDSRGKWERGMPNEALIWVPTQLGADVENDIGNQCYVTGISSDAADFVLPGTMVRLSSPTFNLWNYNEPVLNLELWMNNQNPDDQDFLDANLRIELRTSGGALLTVQELGQQDFAKALEFQKFSFPLNNTDGFSPTTDYQLVISAFGGSTEFQVLEMGFDAFEISGEIDPYTSLDEVYLNESLSVFPNPTNHFLHLELSDNFSDLKRMDLFNARGNLIRSWKTGEDRLDISDLASGLYMLRLENSLGLRVGRRVIKR